MKLAELQKSAAPTSQGAVTPEPVASPAPLEPQSVIPGQMTVDECIAEAPQGTTTVTPSGVEIQYEWAPRRLYRLREGGLQQPEADACDPWFEVPSVTTVLGVLEKPALVWWGQGVGVEGALSLVGSGHLYVGGSPETSYVYGASDGLRATKDSIVALLTEHKLTVNHVKDKAADRGVNVHNALEEWVKTLAVQPGGILPKADKFAENERPYVEGLLGFLRTICSSTAEAQQEIMVGSLRHHYAGRFDLALTLSKPVELVTKTYPKRAPRIEEIPAGRYLLDLKTSKNVYPTHYLQLEAYEAAAVECGYEPTDHRGVIHVTADGRYELALNKDWTFEDFLSVRRCYQTMSERSVIQALRDELDAKEVK